MTFVRAPPTSFSPPPTPFNNTYFLLGTFYILTYCKPPSIAAKPSVIIQMLTVEKTECLDNNCLAAQWFIFKVELRSRPSLSDSTDFTLLYAVLISHLWLKAQHCKVQLSIWNEMRVNQMLFVAYFKNYCVRLRLLL